MHDETKPESARLLQYGIYQERAAGGRLKTSSAAAGPPCLIL